MQRLQYMDWDEFRDAHFRAHVVVLHEESVARRNGDKRLVERLVAALPFTGDCALRSYGPTIHVAFELAADAKRLARVVAARSNRPEPEQASRMTAWLTQPIRQRIAIHLERGVRTEPGKATSTRPPRVKRASPSRHGTKHNTDGYIDDPVVRLE